MSGHSKWSTIKRAKGKTDAQRGKVFTKIGREIAVAVKLGGGDPNTNSKLADIIAKARQNNMPSDNITRSIKKASGEVGGINYEEVMYEGYGVGGSAVMVQCLTDNKNRTAGDVRHLFDKLGAGLGTTNSVGYLFEKKGVLVVEKTENSDEDAIMEMALEAGASDMVTGEDDIEIYTSLNDYNSVKKSLESKGMQFVSTSIEYVPNMKIDLDDEMYEKFERLIDELNELDDVQNVYHNVN